MTTKISKPPIPLINDVREEKKSTKNHSVTGVASQAIDKQSANERNCIRNTSGEKPGFFFDSGQAKHIVGQQKRGRLGTQMPEEDAKAVCTAILQSGKYPILDTKPSCENSHYKGFVHATELVINPADLKDAIENKDLIKKYEGFKISSLTYSDKEGCWSGHLFPTKISKRI